MHESIPYTRSSSTFLYCTFILQIHKNIKPKSQYKNLNLLASTLHMHVNTTPIETRNNWFEKWITLINKIMKLKECECLECGGCYAENKIWRETAPIEIRKVKKWWNGFNMSNGKKKKRKAEKQNHVEIKCRHCNSQSEFLIDCFIVSLYRAMTFIYWVCEWC